MSFHHKSIYVSLVNSIIVMSAYYWWVSGRYADGVFDGPNAGVEVGKSLLILIAAGILVQIIGMILFNILQAIVTNNANPSFLIDERDRTIELKALKVAYNLMALVFLLTIIALTMGWSIFAVFHILVGGGAVIAIVEALTQLFLYRRGY
ncbi:MAG: hypothetical protein GQ535_13140 [Rhodobacteraceae bacterium]|nr:hypothetical protein [Paracoccaceae bacterium]